MFMFAGGTSGINQGASIGDSSHSEIGGEPLKSGKKKIVCTL
jgi:hypothetical protein